MACLRFGGIRVASFLMIGVFCLSIPIASVAASGQTTIQIASADLRAGAIYVGKAKPGNGGGLLCPDGQWMNKDGKCFKCPKGYKHDIAQPTDSPKVCYRK